ncbi:MAG: hypothetical protein ABH862_06375 [Candidatus Omnitrophota bacterium]
MTYLRIKLAGLLVAGICLTAIGLTGCGEKEVSSPKDQQVNESSSIEEIRVPSTAPITEERVYYDFEKDLRGWEIPMWAQGKTDYVAKSAQVSAKEVLHGENSMEIVADFPGGSWTAALVEIQQYLNLSPYRVISVDLYIPEDAPIGLKARFVLTVGENWKFVEMSRSIPLMPGEWSTLTANIEPGSYDWKRVVPDEDFSQDVRKIAIRIESNRQPKYAGPIYVDDVRCGK